MEPDKILVSDFMTEEEEKTTILTEAEKKNIWEEGQRSFSITSALDKFVLK